MLKKRNNMKVELDKSDLKALVLGISPYYSAFDIPLVKQNGSWCGGHVDKWSWNSNLDSLPEEKLFELYNICKKSWNNKLATS